jgi:hypothetical protein
MGKCLSSNIPKSIIQAMSIIFDEVTLAERLCKRQKFNNKGELILTPDGGQRLPISELRTLVLDTMTCKCYWPSIFLMLLTAVIM